jgi:hypothetical protein
LTIWNDDWRLEWGLAIGDWRPIHIRQSESSIDTRQSIFSR